MKYPTSYIPLMILALVLAILAVANLGKPAVEKSESQKQLDVLSWRMDVLDRRLDVILESIDELEEKGRP